MNGGEDMAVDGGGEGPAPPPPPMTPGGTRPMTEEEQKERRASIKAIMTDQSLTPHERRVSISRLMDGRRRSSAGAGSAAGGAMAQAAAAAAAAFDDSSDEDDDDDRVSGGSVASSLTGGDSRRNSYVRRNSNLRASLTMNFSQMGVHGEAGAGGLVETDSMSASGSSEHTHLLGSAIGSSRKMEKTRPECNHYERKCTLISPCCGLAFGCRICHDDCPVLPPPIFMQEDGEHGEDEKPGGAPASSITGAQVAGQSLDKQTKRKMMRSSSLPTSFHEEDTHHNIDRFAIKEVICRECYTRQSSKTNNCIKCNVQFGDYHCNTCNLWMSSDEEPYHCDDCGFCRVGGRANFRHCHDCGMCIDALLFEDHNCKTGKYMSNCPVCQEDLFSSRSASHEMPCGHAIHWHCFRELTSFDTRCPVCKKTAETHEQMAPTWSAMAMGIALQPVPADLARVVTIICNDCEERDEDRRWHFLGVQCMKCTSFNTTIEETTLVGPEAAAFLGDGDGGGAGGGGGSSSDGGEAHAALVGAAVATDGQGDAMDVSASNLGSNAPDDLDFTFVGRDAQRRRAAVGDDDMDSQDVHDMIVNAMDDESRSGQPSRDGGPSNGRPAPQSGQHRGQW